MEKLSALTHQSFQEKVNRCERRKHRESSQQERLLEGKRSHPIDELPDEYPIYAFSFAREHASLPETALESRAVLEIYYNIITKTSKPTQGSAGDLIFNERSEYENGCTLVV